MSTRKPLSAAHRESFDTWVELEIAALPPKLRELLEEVPCVVEDSPAPHVLKDLGIDQADADELCGLHSGVAFTEESVESDIGPPSTIELYRRGIIAQANGWEAGEDAIREQIRITLLHEIGHQFGLDEDDLARLGYD